MLSQIGNLAHRILKRAPGDIGLGTARAHPATEQGAAFDGIGALETAQNLARHAGKSTDSNQLTAAMPLVDGDIDPRMLPFVLARIDIDASWVRRRVTQMTHADFPAVIRLNTGKLIVVTGAPIDTVLTIRDAGGERAAFIDEVERAASGDVLLVGNVDPANGSLANDERERIRANPRLWLLACFVAEKRHFLHLLGAAVLLNLCAFAIPLYMRAVYDRVVPNLAIETMWALSIGAMMVLVFEAMFKQIRSTFFNAIGLKIGQAIQNRAMTAILQARLDQANWTVGSMMTALRDIETMAMLVPQAVVTFAIDIPFFVLFMALIALMGGWVILAPLAGVIAMICVGLISAQGLKFSSQRNSKLLQSRNNLVAEIVGSLHSIKSNQAEGRFQRRWDVLSDHVGVNGRASGGWSELPAFASAFVIQAVTVGMVIISIFEIRAGMMTAGALIACNMLAGRAMGPISAAISVISKGYQSLSQFRALADLLGLEPEMDRSDHAVQSLPFRGHIVLRKVGYVYPETSLPVLHDVDLEVRPGEKIGIIGVAGSGKSTLLKILGGLISQSTGEILVDGHAAAQYSAAQLRQHIAFATQEASLFDDSVYENIVLGDRDIDTALLNKAVATAGVDRFIVRSQEGLGRKVGPAGCRLSGGQRQAVVLARAFMRDPEILLLDEPTAAMDVEAEQAVIRGLKGSWNDRTLIIATHRFAVLELVDRVLWMEDGKIISDAPLDVMMRNLKQRTTARAA